MSKQKAEIETIVALHDDGKTSKEIAEILGYSSYTSVRRNLRKAGVRSCFTNAGEGHGSWKGGRIGKGGYIVVWMPSHPKSDAKGYVKKHILVVENHLGRILRENEVVHHVNGIKTDNHIENLRVMTRSEHSRLHQPKRSCTVCGKPSHAHGFC